MSLILIGTALVGLLASKLLLLSHVTSMVLRYPLAVVISYLAFSGFIKLWLSYITSHAERSSSDAGDILDGITSVPDLSGAPVPSVGSVGGGGGGTGSASVPDRTTVSKPTASSRRWCRLPDGRAFIHVSFCTSSIPPIPPLHKPRYITIPVEMNPR
jgi:hypothetical protein